MQRQTNNNHNNNKQQSATSTVSFHNDATQHHLFQKCGSQERIILHCLLRCKQSPANWEWVRVSRHTLSAYSRFYSHLHIRPTHSPCPCQIFLHSNTDTSSIFFRKVKVFSFLFGFILFFSENNLKIISTWLPEKMVNACTLQWKYKP